MAGRRRCGRRHQPGITGALALARICRRLAGRRFAAARYVRRACRGALRWRAADAVFPAPVTAVLGLALVWIGLAFVLRSPGRRHRAVYWQPARLRTRGGSHLLAWCLAAISLPVLGAGYLSTGRRLWHAV